MVTPRDTDNVIHVSGHPCRDEIADMLQWIRPGCLIPVHGEHIQLQAHAELGRSCQIPRAIVPQNGSVIKLAPGTVDIAGDVEAGLLAFDRKRILPSNHQSITARRKLQYTGAVHVSMVLDMDYRLVGQLKLDTVGLNIGPDGDITDRELTDEIISLLPEDGSAEDWDEDEIAEEVRIPVEGVRESSTRNNRTVGIHLS